MYDGSLFQSLTILIEKVLMYDGSLFQSLTILIEKVLMYDGSLYQSLTILMMNDGSLVPIVNNPDRESVDVRW